MTVGRVVVEADGGSRGNPGPAGYGAVVRDAATGAVLAERAAGLGTATNNVAEYSGLIAGLRAAVELGATEVDVRMDSKLVVEQLSGRWQVKHPALQPLAREAAALVRQLGRVRFTWIPRASNKHADALANAAMDAQANGTTWSPRATAASADEEPDLGLDVRSTAAATRPAGPSGAAPGAAPFSSALRPGTDPVLAEPVDPARPVPSPGPASWTGAKGTPTRLLLLRHGQTPYSVENRYSGRGDIPLTPLGERQAEALAKRMSTVDGVAAVVSSPLRRCTRTAELVASALSAPMIVHKGLIETDFGAWDGLTFAEAAARDPELHARWLSDASIAPPGGESFDSVHRRVRRARDELITEHGAATVVVVSHVTPIKTLLRMALAAGQSILFRLHLDIASLSVVEFYPDGAASVRLVNDTSHL